MKLKVLQIFSDKNTNETYEVGKIIDVTDERGEELLSYPHGRLVEVVEEKAKKTTKKKAK